MEPTQEVDGGQTAQMQQPPTGRTALEVVLDANGREDEHEFHPGEQVVGSVRVTLEEPSELRGVEVQLQGVGTVQWNERTRGAQGDVSMPVVAQELYLSETQNILGSYPGTVMYSTVTLVTHGLITWASSVQWTAFEHRSRDTRTGLYCNCTRLCLCSGETQTLSRGTHSFPFRFRLPPVLPSSFSGASVIDLHYSKRSGVEAIDWKQSFACARAGKYGSVHYDLRARLAAPGGALLCSETLNVRQELSATAYSKFLRPAEVSLRRMYAGKGMKSMSAGTRAATTTITSSFSKTLPLPTAVHFLRLSRSLSLFTLARRSDRGALRG